MSQLAQLSEAEIEDRYHITGKTAIQFMLAGFVRQRESFAVHFHAGSEQFLTTLLAVQPDKQRLILDCSGSPETNRRFLADERSTFIGRPGGIQVQFACAQASEVLYEGGKAFAVPLPALLVRLQRRESFRIETPYAKPLQVFGRLPGGGLLKLPAHDLSISGVGLTAHELLSGLEVGIALENGRCQLPDDATEFFFKATVQHLTEREARSGLHHWRVGLQFRGLSAADEKRLQRYIDRVERERHELG